MTPSITSTTSGYPIPAADLMMFTDATARHITVVMEHVQALTQRVKELEAETEYIRNLARDYNTKTVQVIGEIKKDLQDFADNTKTASHKVASNLKVEMYQEMDSLRKTLSGDMDVQIDALHSEIKEIWNELE